MKSLKNLFKQSRMALLMVFFLTLSGIYIASGEGEVNAGMPAFEDAVTMLNSTLSVQENVNTESETEIVDSSTGDPEPADEGEDSGNTDGQGSLTDEDSQETGELADDLRDGDMLEDEHIPSGENSGKADDGETDGGIAGDGETFGGEIENEEADGVEAEVEEADNEVTDSEESDENKDAGFNISSESDMWSLKNAVTMSESTLSKQENGGLLIDDEIVYSTDSLWLTYEFFMDAGQINTIRAALNSGMELKYSVTIPTGLMCVESGITDIYADSVGETPLKFAELVADPYGEGVYVCFTGEFWESEQTEISYASISVTCGLDMEEIGEAETYTIFVDPAEVTVKVGDNLPKVGAFASNYMMPGRTTDLPSLENAVTMIDTTLYKLINGVREEVDNDDIIYSTESLLLIYKFEIGEEKFTAIKSAVNGETSTARISVLATWIG